MNSLKSLIKLANYFEKKIKLAQLNDAFVAGKQAGIEFATENELKLEIAPECEDEDFIRAEVSDKINKYLYEQGEFLLEKAASEISHDPNDHGEMSHRLDLADAIRSGEPKSLVMQKDFEARSKKINKSTKEKTMFAALAGMVATIADHWTNFVMHGRVDSAINSSLELKFAIKRYLMIGIPRDYQNFVGQTLAEFLPLYLAGFLCGLFAISNVKRKRNLKKELDYVWERSLPSNENFESGNEYPGSRFQTVEELRNKYRR